MQPWRRRRGGVRAIDTNVVVRFLTGDDEAQSARARKLIKAGDIFVATTVLLEAEWVLRSAYGLSAERIVGALRGLAGLPGVRLEDAPLVAQALDWAERGLDFADALHLGRAGLAAVLRRARARASRSVPSESPRLASESISSLCHRMLA